VWGRGTNRVIEECRRYGVDAPTFEKQGGSVEGQVHANPGSGKTEGDQGPSTPMGITDTPSERV
jgi:predicted HTH transcriptional regulator